MFSEYHFHAFNLIPLEVRLDFFEYLINNGFDIKNIEILDYDPLDVEYAEEYEVAEIIFDAKIMRNKKSFL